jgi:ketosteroid isomerase-like protein
MNETDVFLAATRPRYHEAETALHHGDTTLRKAMWSRVDPVTLFGAGMSGTGWDEIEPVFDHLERSFTGCVSYRNEIIAAGASRDLAYTVALEHTTASINDEPPTTYMLRATTVFRREDGEWKIVHRHGDPLASTAAAELIGALVGIDPRRASAARPACGRSR